MNSTFEHNMNELEASSDSVRKNLFSTTAGTKNSTIYIHCVVTHKVFYNLKYYRNTITSKICRQEVILAIHTVEIIFKKGKYFFQYVLIHISPHLHFPCLTRNLIFLQSEILCNLLIYTLCSDWLLDVFSMFFLFAITLQCILMCIYI